MGYFGELHLSDKLPSPELIPMEDIQAVHGELGKAFEHNTGIAESLEEQLNKIKLREQVQPYATNLAKEVTEEINKIRDNPFEMPYANKMIRNLANEKYINNIELHEHIRDKQNEDQYYSEMSNLRKGYTMLDEGEQNIDGESKKGSSGGGSSKYRKIERYPSDIIEKSILISQSRNQKTPVFNPETKTLENSFSGYQPVPPIDISEALIKNIDKVKDYYDESGGSDLQETSREVFLRKVETKTLDRSKAEILARRILSENHHYNDYLKQKVLFEKVDNTIRDENGLLTFDENGDYNDLNVIGKAWSNTKFRWYLEDQFEEVKVDKAGVEVSREAKSKEIGLVASNEDDFLNFMISDYGRNLYYKWFEVNEKNEIIKDMGDVFSFNRYKFSYIKDPLAMERIKDSFRNTQDLNARNFENFGSLNFSNEKVIDKLQESLANAKTKEDKAYWEKMIRGTLYKDLHENVKSKKFRSEFFKAILANKEAKEIFKKDAIGTFKNKGFLVETPYYKKAYEKNIKKQQDKKTAHDNAILTAWNKMYNQSFINFSDGFQSWLDSASGQVGVGNRLASLHTYGIAIGESDESRRKLLDSYRKILEIDEMRKFYNLGLSKHGINGSTLQKVLFLTYDYGKNGKGSAEDYVNIYREMGRNKNMAFVTPYGTNPRDELRQAAKDGRLFYTTNNGTRVDINETMVGDINFDFKNQISADVIDNACFGTFNLVYNDHNVGINTDGKKKDGVYQMMLSPENRAESRRMGFQSHMEFAENPENIKVERINSFYAASNIASGDVNVFSTLYHARDYRDIYDKGIEYEIRDPIDNSIYKIKKYDAPIFDESGTIRGFEIKNNNYYTAENPMPVEDYKLKMFLETMNKAAMERDDGIDRLKYLNIAKDLGLL